MDLDIDISLVSAFLAVSAGLGMQLILWVPSALSGVAWQIFPLVLSSSLVLLAVGAWRLVTHFRDRGLYEPSIHPTSSFDQNERLRKVSEHLKNVEGSLASFERFCLRDLGELKARLEKLERINVVPQPVDSNPEEPKKPTEETESRVQIPPGPPLEESSQGAQKTEKREPNSSAPSEKPELFSFEEWIKKAAQSKDEPLSSVSAELLEKPMKKQLAALKEKLGIKRGCVTYKDGSVYLVTSEEKKHVWRKLGRWRDLATSLTAPHT